MKTLSKPLSSPSRTDKFPPPLTKFLRTNVGSRSRGRSRSSPMFYLRTKKTAIESTQEPSSPKVTCIGQVRVRRRAESASDANRRRCWWRSNSSFRRLCKCGLFSRLGYCKKVDVIEDSFRVYSPPNCGDVDCGNRFKNLRVGSDAPSSSSSPPKNALILTRCRSAPYRSSSLGGIFWGASAEKDEDYQTKTEQLRSENGEEKEEKFQQEIKQPSLLLTRCRSEPARTGERLNSEAIFSREIRLDYGDVHNHVKPPSQIDSS